MTEDRLSEAEGEDIEHFVDEAWGAKIAWPFFEVEGNVFGILGLDI